MRNFVGIDSVSVREVFDAEGNPAIRVQVVTEFDDVGTAISGTQTCKNIPEVITEKMRGKNIFAQREIDNMLIELDGTEDKSRLGAGTMFAVSSAVARAAANHLDIPVSVYLGGISGSTIPCPMMSMLMDQSGGEILIVPDGIIGIKERVKACVEVYRTLQILLKNRGLVFCQGREGELIADFSGKDKPIEILKEAILAVGYQEKIQIYSHMPENSIVIRPNEIGTVTESIHAIRTAKQQGMIPIVALSSHETEDSFLADLCVAINVKFIKTGAPVGSEVMSKWNELCAL
ncbi:MAG: hypothetical protein IJ215_05115 [Clostridia bacterium]|nr:hypothetical protein [Clostridia bacterium]